MSQSSHVCLKVPREEDEAFSFSSTLRKKNQTGGAKAQGGGSHRGATQASLK